MEKYPDRETYKALYKRFYDGRKPEELIALAGSLKGKAVLDLCSGDGRLSLEAARHGADSVWIVEKEKKMLSEELRKKIYTYITSVQDFLQTRAQLALRFDVAFCQQGVNFWLNGDTAKLVADVLKKDGVFIFNTFSKKPPEKPMAKEYELDGQKFIEVSWLVDGVVHHVQIREGMPPHTTTFAWLSTDYLEKILSPYFHLAIHFQNNTSIYRCLRK